MKHIKKFENYNTYDKLVDYNKNPMLRGYIECALFADLPEEYVGEIQSEDINDNSLIDAFNDVDKFKKRASTLLDNMTNDELSQVGMDFWYTRNGHGTGFFDRENIYGKDLAMKLEEIAKTFEPKYVYVENGEFFIE